MMNEFPCVIIADCHGNKHFSALTGNVLILKGNNSPD